MDPNQDALKRRLENVRRLHLNLYSILSISEVGADHAGLSLAGDRSNLVVHHPRAGSPGPVYYPARRGCEFLAEYFNDERFLTIPARPPQPQYLFHWLAITDTQIVEYVDRFPGLATSRPDQQTH